MAINLDELIAFHKAECMRQKHGRCSTYRCMKRGGWVRGVTEGDFETVTDLATCESHETVCALEHLKVVSPAFTASALQKATPQEIRK